MIKLKELGGGEADRVGAGGRAQYGSAAAILRELTGAIRHALCWVRAERLAEGLDRSTEPQRAAETMCAR